MGMAVPGRCAERAKTARSDALACCKLMRCKPNGECRFIDLALGPPANPTKFEPSKSPRIRGTRQRYRNCPRAFRTSERFRIGAVLARRQLFGRTSSWKLSKSNKLDCASPHIRNPGRQRSSPPRRSCLAEIPGLWSTFAFLPTHHSSPSSLQTCQQAGRRRVQSYIDASFVFGSPQIDIPWRTRIGGTEVVTDQQIMATIFIDYMLPAKSARRLGIAVGVSICLPLAAILESIGSVFWARTRVRD